MRRFVVAGISIVALILAFSPTALADDKVKVHDSGSPDSGTCGNNWANDTFGREFDLQHDRGSFVLTESFKDGRS